MSWFNLNDGLSNIRGQISNFASGVLNDGLPSETENPTRVQELENTIARLEEEVKTLRDKTKCNKQNNTNTQDDHHGNGEDNSWTWEPQENPHKLEISQKDDLIAELKERIDSLQKEKCDLNESLDQLDADCQRTTDKLITLKDALQTEHNELKLQHKDLKKSYDHLFKTEATNRKNIENLQSENKKLSQELHQLRVAKKNNTTGIKEENHILFNVDRNNELKLKYEALLKSHEDLKIAHDMICDELEEIKQRPDSFGDHSDLKRNEVSNKEFVELKKEHETLKLNFEALKEGKKSLQEDNESLKCNNESSMKDTANLKQENASLKHENASLKDENASLKQDNATLKQDNTILKEENEFSKEESIALKQDNETLKIDNETLKIANESLKFDNAALKQHADSLKQDAESLTLNSESLNQSTESLKQAIEFLQQNVESLNQQNEALKQDNQLMKQQSEALSQRYASLEQQHESLQNLHESLQQSHLTAQDSNVSLTQSNESLKQTNDTLKQAHDHLIHDHDNLKETIKASLDPELSKQEHIYLMKQNIDLLDKLISLHSITKNYEETVRETEALSLKLREENEDLVNKLISLEKENESIHGYYKDTFAELTAKIKQYESSGTGSFAKNRDDLHKTYMQIIKDGLKKFVDYDLQIIETDDSTIAFNNVIETIIKLILDFKWKTETLEKEVVDLTQEKTKILTEKNCEIEKLLVHSENLSQEVIMKTQALKDCEKECSELDKNNVLLIEELESYKNNTGLQTISESNEDNLLMMESQLESANRKIKDLELTLVEIETSKQDGSVEMQSELDYIKKQLNITGTELSQCKKEYQDLTHNYVRLEEDNSLLEKDINEIREVYRSCCADKQDLANLLEKTKSDLETMEYKYTEMNISMDCLKEELETLQKNQNSERVEALEDTVETLTFKFNALSEENVAKEIIIRDLTEKMQNAKVSETSFKMQCDTLKEAKQKLEAQILNLTNKYQSIGENCMQYESKCSDLESLNSFLNEKCNDFKSELETSTQKAEELSRENTRIMNELKNLDQSKIIGEKNINLQSAVKAENTLEIAQKHTESIQQNYDEYLQKISALEAQLVQVHTSRNELIALLTSKQNENIAYYQEIQRLSQCLNLELEQRRNLEAKLHELQSLEMQQGGIDLKQIESLAKELEVKKSEVDYARSEMEKILEQNEFLKQKCEIMAQNLLFEQSNVQKALAERANVSDKEQALQKELERLRAHLLEVEETYTQELVGARTKNDEMLSKVNEIEMREKNSSTMYTSISIRANQQVETLQNQLQLVTHQREELRKKISDSEDQISKQSAALTNLQFVLEQFQKDQDNHIYQETERIRRKIEEERKVQDDLKKEIAGLRGQLDESKQGLQAASRLSDQLETAKQAVTMLKEEVSKLQDKLKLVEEENKTLTTQTDTKVDKTLVKNLIMGFITTNNNLNKDQLQILKIISTVLDFSKQDNEKVKLNRQHGSWLNSILHPQSPGQIMTQESLSQAFVRFLEKESKPRELPNLLETQSASNQSTDANSSSGSKNAPILLSQVVLPTFSDFAQNRNSSSILKDVLKDNS